MLARTAACWPTNDRQVNGWLRRWPSRAAAMALTRIYRRRHDTATIGSHGWREGRDWRVVRMFRARPGRPQQAARSGTPSRSALYRVDGFDVLTCRDLRGRHSGMAQQHARSRPDEVGARGASSARGRTLRVEPSLGTLDDFDASLRRHGRRVSRALDLATSRTDHPYVKAPCVFVNAGWHHQVPENRRRIPDIYRSLRFRVLVRAVARVKRTWSSGSATGEDSSGSQPPHKCPVREGLSAISGCSTRTPIPGRSVTPAPM